MTRTEISYGSTRLIALLCESDQDLGEIGKRFYETVQTSGRCPCTNYRRGMRVEMVMDYRIDKPPDPSPCRIHSVNSGRPLPNSVIKGKGIYFYDFAVVGECSELDNCLDDFLALSGLREVESKTSTMSDGELNSIMKRRSENEL